MKSLLIAVAIGFIYLRADAQPCQTGKLDPRVAKTLKTVLPDLPASATTSVEQIRDVKLATPTFPPADVQTIRITADSIPLHIYNPAHATGLPILISFHPGGFVTPMLPFMKYDCWRQARVYNAVVIAVDYRVAPEYKFPAAVTDAYNTVRWAIRHGHAYGGDTSRIVVLGLSAGGNLAAVVCQKANEEGWGNKIKLQVLNCPSTDNPRNWAAYPSYERYASGYFLTKAFCQYSIQAYAPDASMNNAEVAPIQRRNLTGLPPALIITAEFDPLRDEGYAYAERLRKAGVPVQYTCFPGQIHCLLGLPPAAEQQKEVDRLVIATMRRVFNR